MHILHIRNNYCRCYNNNNRGAGTAGEEKEKEWNALFAKYKEAHPELAAEYERRQKGDLPAGWKDKLPRFTAGAESAKALATRASSGGVLNALAEVMPEIIGGSADLTPSNVTS
jgi:transketolase